MSKKVLIISSGKAQRMPVCSVCVLHCPSQGTNGTCLKGHGVLKMLSTPLPIYCQDFKRKSAI